MVSAARRRDRTGASPARDRFPTGEVCELLYGPLPTPDELRVAKAALALAARAEATNG